MLLGIDVVAAEEYGARRGAVCVVGTRGTYQRTLLRACAIAGDEVALAAHLGVPVSAVVDWLLDERPLPADVFLRVVDIVLASTRQQNDERRDELTLTKEQVRRDSELIEGLTRRYR